METVNDIEEQQASLGPGALTVSLDDFAALEDRIRKAVERVKNERQARAEAEERATQAEARAASAESQLQAQAPVLEQQQQELSALHSEREQVRQRVDRLLSQLDSLEL